MAGHLREIHKGRVYRTLQNQGLMVRILSIDEVDGGRMVLVETTRSGEVKMLTQEPYDKLLVQMNNWQMFELPVITPDPTY